MVGFTGADVKSPALGPIVHSMEHGSAACRDHWSKDVLQDDAFAFSYADAPKWVKALKEMPKILFWETLDGPDLTRYGMVY